VFNLNPLTFVYFVSFTVMLIMEHGLSFLLGKGTCILLCQGIDQIYIS